MLEMTQAQLAQKSRLGLSTVVDYEKMRRQVSPEAVSTIRAALEQSGIQFISENGGGAGVRLKKGNRHK